MMLIHFCIIKIKAWYEIVTCIIGRKLCPLMPSIIFCPPLLKKKIYRLPSTVNRSFLNAPLSASDHYVEHIIEHHPPAQKNSTQK